MKEEDQLQDNDDQTTAMHGPQSTGITRYYRNAD